MKRERNPFIRFTSTVFLLTATGIMLGMSSCKKDNDTSASVSEEEIAESISQSVATDGGGLVVQATATATAVNNAAARIGGKLSDQCGVPHTDVFSGSSAAGALVTFSYSFSRNWLLTCNGTTPQQFEFNYKGKATYDAPRMSSDDSATAKIVVTNLDSSYYLYNHQYTREGSQVSKIRNKRSFKSLIFISATDIKIDKSTLKIVSGTATATVSGEGADGHSFNYTGTVTFLGNQTATLVLGNGGTYTITW
ncbi:hypothetical protein [Chitinophaga sp. CF418]|uniref:hypothetical protein n=1 Tax=Chitinophaga sp. CF418 TaxID=1855287 RepID=UPI00091F6D4B|nr:hypothetical protein [Chitinophaga sp. CF418]SHN11580.1 hypothetical protein SAMN05216311_105253 [Chitinophaga sp. CF418]